MSRRSSARKLQWAAGESGAAAVEFAMLFGPLVLILLGGLQFYALHAMQSTLSDALYQSASRPECEPELLAGNKAGYTTKLCKRTAFPSTCNATIKLEMSPLNTVAAPPSSTVASPITGAVFNQGTSNNVLLLRASVNIDQFYAGTIPIFTAKSAVVFRRPNVLKICS